MYTGVSGFRDSGFWGCRALECPRKPQYPQLGNMRFRVFGFKVQGLGFRV